MSKEPRLVLGIQPVREALRVHGTALTQLWLEEGAHPRIEGLARMAAHEGVTVTSARRSELDRLSKGTMHQGAAALAPPLRVLDLPKLIERLEAEREQAPIVLVLDGIMDPQNFGATVRCAVALGARYVVWPEHGSAPLTPSTFRASAGAIEHAVLARVPSLPAVVIAMREVGYDTVLLEAGADATLSEIDLTVPIALIVGAEDRGSKPAVRRAVAVKAKLPMVGAIDSLNASVAAGIALYEVVRQRQVPKTSIES